MILLRTTRNRDRWVDAFRQALPHHDVTLWPDPVDPEAVEFFCVWKHDWEDLANYPNLRGLMLVSAGIDQVDFDLVPEGVPVVRLVDPAMSQDIAEYCLHWVTHFSRSFDQYQRQQPNADWTIGPRNPQTTVGILGFGAIGSVVADTVAGFGHDIITWSRSAKSTNYGEHFVGGDELTAFLEQCDVVVNLLPASDATNGILDADAFAALGSGALINVGRGSTVNDEALLAALANDSDESDPAGSGGMRCAVLDVFHTEPLPTDSPLWHHPRVIVTPHIAGETNPYTAAKVMGANIERIERGETPHNIVTATTY